MTQRRWTGHGAPILETIEVSPNGASVAVAETLQLTALGRYSGGLALDLTTSVEWSTSNSDVAVVDDGGLVMVVGSGVANIAATMGDASGGVVVIAVGEPGFFWFRFTLAAPSSDFFVPLPSEQGADTYAVKLAHSKGAAMVTLEAPDEAPSDRTTAQFRVVSSAPLAAGDRIDVFVAV